MTNAQIADLSIGNSKLAALSVDTSKIADLAISTAKLGDLAITNGKLAALAVDAAKLATNAVTETKIADNSISTGKIIANAVAADKIAANAISAKHIRIWDSSNLFVNPSFGSMYDAANTNGWNVVGTSAIVTKTGTTGILGLMPSVYSVKITPTTTLANNAAVVDLIANSRMQVRPGDKYVMEFDIAGEGTSAFLVTPYIRYYNRC